MRDIPVVNRSGKVEKAAATLEEERREAIRRLDAETAKLHARARGWESVSRRRKTR